jgi:H+/Cl- antiporter ClcA
VTPPEGPVGTDAPPTGGGSGPKPGSSWRKLLADAWSSIRSAGTSTKEAVREVEPDFWRNVGDELAGGRQWADRALVMLFAGITGLIMVGFTLLAESAAHVFNQFKTLGIFGPWLALVWTPAITVAILWWAKRFAPGTAGSGIPQVMRAIETDLHPSQQDWLVSLRGSMHKIGLVTGGMLAGLSIGREGPAVQIGAGVMGYARRFLSKRSEIDAHDLMVAGAAAGIAAVFNTPLGGIMFALEKLSSRRGISHSALVISGIVLAGLISVSVFGNTTYFGRLGVQDLSWNLFGPGLMVALAAGLFGGLFARLMVLSTRGLPDRYCRWREAYPMRFAAGCAFVVAVIGIVTGGATSGAGYAPTRAMLEGTAELPGVFTLLKFCATWLSAWTGVPAGVFAPSLTIGAGIGHDIALLYGLGSEAAIPLIALGMVGFLSATTQGPITAFIIVMEMVSGHSMVLSLMACSLLASGVSRLLTKPMYHELALLLPIPLPSDDRPLDATPASTGTTAAAANPAPKAH